MTDLKAPFPWFGGKKPVADEIWRRFGDVDRYIEPFAGTGAVLLQRPNVSKDAVEILNDANGFIINAYRAITADPEAVWRHVDYPVSELDLRARHADLQRRLPNLVERLENDPRFYDAEAAGWWVWGASSAIGSQWIRPKLPRGKPNLGNSVGVLAQIGGLPLLNALASRLKSVIFTCGDWKRVVTFAALHQSRSDPEMAGVLLDPPYLMHDRETRIYGVYDKSDTPASESYAWAVETAKTDPHVRIAYCTYEGHFPVPDGWSVYRWKAWGGMGNNGNAQGRVNKGREVIYFSPSCLNDVQQPLFE
jgi:site-specific DNA-adenine methylase